MVILLHLGYPLTYYTVLAPRGFIFKPAAIRAKPRDRVWPRSIVL